MRCTSCGGGAAWLLAGWLAVACCAMAQESFPLLKSSEVKSSLEENGPSWKAKIDAAGRPRLLYGKAGQAALRERLLAEPRSPEVTELLRRAYELAPAVPHAYVSPEEMEKAKGLTPFAAGEELWIRDVGGEITILAVAAWLDPSPVLKKALHSAVIEICRYPTWGRLPGTSNDLACAHAARGVALAWDWFPDLWTEKDRDLILKTIASRANQLLAGLYGGGNAFWAAGYQDNHNHVDCGALAWCGLAFYTDIPRAPEWLAAARLDFQNVARYFPEDGSSAEGVPYWSYGLGSVLQYIEGTRGIIDSGDLYQAPFLKNTVKYRLNASTSGLGGTLPWGDSPLKDYYGPQHILNRLAVEYRDPAAAWLSHKIPFPATGNPDIVVWTALWQSDAGSMMPPLPLDYHHWVSDIVTTRSGWGPGDYLLSIKSGFNNRNHTHLDAGALALAFGSEWLLTAPGYGKGADSPDFWDSGKKRWDFFENATESHCTLLINGQNQRHDHAARGTITRFSSAPYWSWTEINLTGAYKEAASVRRDVLHRRGDYILVFDSVISKLPAESNPSPEGSSNPAVTVEWLAQLPSEPERQQDSLIVSGDAGQLLLKMLSPALPFTPRHPTSPHVDAAPNAIHTFAVKSGGATVDFIAMLQPSFSDGPLPDLKATVAEQKSGFAHVVISAKDWTDHVFNSGAGEAVEIAAEGVKLTAKAAAIRKEAEGVTSCLVLEAGWLDLPGIGVKPATPANIALQKMPGGSWIVDADHDIQAAITAEGFTICPIGQEKFRYLLSKDGTTSQQASEWLVSLVQFREKAAISVRVLPAQPPLASAAVIPIEAEKFSRQGFGNAEEVNGKPGAIGTSLRNFGNGTPDHFIDWQFEVPQAGQYQLVIRYATKLADVHVSVLVDGAAPSQDLVNLALPATGGWSRDEDNWKNLPVNDAQGKPFVFHLSQGSHKLRLAKPTGALALDRLEFHATGQP